MPTTGIYAQSAGSIREDVLTFYFGGTAPWIVSRETTAEPYPKLKLTLWNPENEDPDDLKQYEVTSSQIKDAFSEANRRGYHLCCRNDIQNEQLGYGCAQDLDIILQTAAYGRLVFG